MAESSNVRLTRLLTLVPWLAAHSGVSKRDAAAHFDLTLEQLEADLALITFTGPGVYGGELVDLYFDDETITVYDSQGLDRPLRLTADEIAALLVGLRALQQLPDTDAVAIAGCLEKLGATGESATDLAVSVQAPHVAQTIGEAIATRRDATIEYLHPLRDDTTVRRITPMRLFSANGADYVEAWCHAVEAQRTFRLDRILACTLDGSRSQVPGPGADTPLRDRATVSVQPHAQHVLEGIPAKILETDPIIRAEIEYSDERWLVQWLLSAGGGVRLLKPSAVQEVAVQRAEAALLAYAAVGAL